MAPTFIRRQFAAELFKDLYNLNSEAKYVAMFDMIIPTVMLRDLELIKSITLKYFDMFPEHHAFMAEDQDPLLIYMEV